MISSAATDPFAAILASPGAASPTGEAGAMSTGGLFGAMVAAAPAGMPAAAATPPSFRGALMTATLPVGTLVSAGTPAAAPAIAVLPWSDVTTPLAAPVAPPMRNPATIASPVPAALPSAMPAAVTPTAMAGPPSVSIAPAVTPVAGGVSPPLPAAMMRSMPAPAPSTILRSATLAAAMPIASPSTPAAGLALPVAPVTALPVGSGSGAILVAAPRLDPASPVGSAPAVVPVMLPNPDASPIDMVRPAVAQPASAPVPPTDAVTVAPLPDLELLAGPAAEPVSIDPVAPPVGQAKPARTDCVAVPEIQPEDVRENLALPAEPDAPMPATVVPSRPDRQGPVLTRTSDATIAGKPAASQQPVIAPAPTPAIFAAAAPSTTAPPMAAKGTPTPAEPAPTDEGALAEAEEEPTVVATPMAMAPLPVPIEVAPPPADPAAPPKSDHADADTPSHGAPAAAIAPPVATPAPMANAESTAAPDRPATVAAAGVRPVREEAVTAEAKPATAAAHPAPGAFAALVEPKPVTAAPVAAATPPSPVPEARVMAEPGRMGHEMAVAIARHTAEGGGEALTVRLNPAEFGRIDVTLSFDDRGTLRAVLAAETPAALDVLRRDSADLGRALSDAGMRTDAQSFRFDTRQGGADAGGQGAQGQQRWQPAATPRTLATATADLPEPEYRPLRTRGGVDLMA